MKPSVRSFAPISVRGKAGILGDGSFSQPDPDKPLGASEWLRAAPLLFLAALLAILPLLLHGPSCGHDFTFHLESWLDAEAQLRHGTLLPHWTYTAAWNAGEPRFVFYPPLSWMLGAGLTAALPFAAVPVVFTWLALSVAAVSMYRLARDHAGPGASLLAAAVYLAGPYAMFTAFERTAYGELLAAAWLPLLLRAALQRRLSITAIALPLALLWLTNAPAAVMGSYGFGLIVLSRVLLNALARARRSAGSAQRHDAVTLLLHAAAGGALGCLLPAFYLLPAAYERRWVQISMAIIPNMRVEDNFLFGHTGDGPHDAVLHTASLLAVGLLATCAVVLGLAAFRRTFPQAFTRSTPSSRSGRELPAGLRSREVPRASTGETPTGGTASSPLAILAVLAILAAVIAFLLTPASRRLWQSLPELTFLQFPWRLLLLLSLILACGLALLLARWRLGPVPSAALTLGLTLAGGLAAQHKFRQACELNDFPERRLALFATHHGVAATDEYTPTDADNDVLRSDNPGFWLAQDPAAFAAGSVPNPAAVILDYDVPPPVEQTVSGRAPTHLHLRLAAPAVLLLNLRAYPAWRVLRNGVPLLPIARDDGLMAVRLPAGDSEVDLRWRTTTDQLAGAVVSAAAAIALAAAALAERGAARRVAALA